MENQPEDILENLTFVNGKEEVGETPKPKKKAKKKVAEPKSEPVKKYSLEELSKKSTTALTNICKELGVSIARRKPQMIENILNNN
jgi:hypothetical protein